MSEDTASNQLTQDICKCVLEQISESLPELIEQGVIEVTENLRINTATILMGSPGQFCVEISDEIDAVDLGRNLSEVVKRNISMDMDEVNSSKCVPDIQELATLYEDWAVVFRDCAAQCEKASRKLSNKCRP